VWKLHYKYEPVISIHFNIDTDLFLEINKIFHLIKFSPCIIYHHLHSTAVAVLADTAVVVVSGDERGDLVAVSSVETSSKSKSILY
jgi:hypothetical protein